MTDTTYPVFPLFTFLGFFLPLVPLPWHLEVLNSGTCFFIMWSSLACLNQFINSVVWAGNILNHAPWWCEISIRIMMGASVGIPAASLCINRRLYKIATVQAATITLADKHRAILIDSLICVLFPLIYIALQYVVQGHRFNLFEDIGCYPALYNTLLTFFISSMWPLVIGLVSATYCVLTLRSFSKRRAEFGQFLSSNTTLTMSRYFRLMALAMTEICATAPLAIFMIWLNATATPVGPWRSWEDTHFAYSRVEQIPAILWRSNNLLVIAMEFSRWVNPVCSLVFFAFFGFAHEARKQYHLVWSNVKTRLPCWRGGVGKDFKQKPRASNGLDFDYASKHPVSPTSWVAFQKSPCAYSLTTTASTQASNDFELDSHMKYHESNMGINKSSKVSFHPIASDASDAATLCNNTPTFRIWRKPIHISEDVSDTPLSSPWSFASSRLEQGSDADLPGVPSALDMHSQTVAPHVQPLSQPQSQPTAQPHLQPYAPKMKTSKGSMRTITLPDRDRFYIVTEGRERAQTPESPRPFASTVPPAGSSGGPGSGIQVMVHKMVRSTEELR